MKDGADTATAADIQLTSITYKEEWGSLTLPLIRVVSRISLSIGTKSLIELPHKWIQEW